MEKFVCQDSIIQKPVQNAERVGLSHYTVAKVVPTAWTFLEYRRSSQTDRPVQGLGGTAAAENDRLGIAGMLLFTSMTDNTVSNQKRRIRLTEHVV